MTNHRFGWWLELGRCVRRDEKGIVLLAPVYDSELISTQLGFIPAEEAGGFIIPQDDEQEVFFLPPNDYRVTYVFDVAQTDPLPGYENDVPNHLDIGVPVLAGGDGAELYEVLLKVAEAESITVDATDGHHETPGLRFIISAVIANRIPMMKRRPRVWPMWCVKPSGWM